MSMIKTLNALTPYWDLYSQKLRTFEEDIALDVLVGEMGENLEEIDSDQEEQLIQKEHAAYDLAFKELDKSICKTDRCIDYCIIEMKEPVQYGNKHITKRTYFPGPIITYQDILTACTVFVDKSVGVVLKKFELDASGKIPTFYVSFY